ncbi:MAG: hypothetical protein ACK5QH_08900 [Rubrivivax sp.]
MKRSIAVMASALLCHVAAAQLAPLEFKGLAPGGDASQVTAHPAWRCRAQEIDGADTVCSRQHETIAGASTEGVFVTAKEGTIMSVLVSFAQSDFAQVHEALVAKYGRPTKTQAELKRSRIGAQFASQVSEWRRQNVYMRAEERTNSADVSMLFISSDLAARQSNEQRKQQSQRNKSDL